MNNVIESSECQENDYRDALMITFYSRWLITKIEKKIIKQFYFEKMISTFKLIINKFFIINHRIIGLLIIEIFDH